MGIEAIIEKILFRPVKLASDFVYHFDHEFEELFFYPEKGVKINAIHFQVQNPKGIVLYFHGNKDNLARWGKIASGLTRFPYDVIVIDYRGYGKSIGERTEQTLYSDALFCYKEIQDKLKPQRIVLYGRSLGTGIASWLAGKVRPYKLVLETPYYDMTDLLGSYIPEFVFRNKLNFKLSSFKYLQNTTFPILIFHGTSDELVPYISGVKLFESLNNPQKSFVTIDGGRHNELYKYKLYWKKLENFLS